MLTPESDAERDARRAFVVEPLVDTRGVLIVDEAEFLKTGWKPGGV